MGTGPRGLRNASFFYGFRRDYTDQKHYGTESLLGRVKQGRFVCQELDLVNQGDTVLSRQFGGRPPVG